MNNSIDFDHLKSMGLAQADSKATKPHDKLAQEDFLKLLTTQLSNQDPTNPQDGGEFLSQMAQFGTVNGITELQNAFKSLAGTLSSQKNLQAASLVGKTVTVPTSSVTLGEEGTVAADLNVPTAVGDIKLSIMNSQGELVRQVNLGRTTAGQHPVQWDGTDSSGKRLPQGQYQLRAEATVNGEVHTIGIKMAGKVDGVDMSSDVMQLNIAGIGKVALDQVQEIKNA